MSYSSVILAEASVVSYWDLQETAGSTTAVDSKSGLDLNVSVGSYTFGGAGPGGSLATSWVSDGTTGQLRRTVAAASALDITGVVSFDCWAQVNGTNASDYGYFMSRASTSYAFGTRSSGVLEYHGGSNDADSSTSGVSSGSWTHYGYSVSAGGVVTFYTNGVQVGTTVASQVPASSSQAICLGAWDQVPSFFVNAAIAGCAIYNTALSGASILAHYNALAGAAPTAHQLGLTGVGA